MKGIPGRRNYKLPRREQLYLKARWIKMMPLNNFLICDNKICFFLIWKKKKKKKLKAKQANKKPFLKWQAVFESYVWGTIINNSHVFTIIVYKKQWGRSYYYSHLWDEENGKCDKEWLSMLLVVRQILRAGVPYELGQPSVRALLRTTAEFIRFCCCT